jgi:hypothetical protein
LLKPPGNFKKAITLSKFKKAIANVMSTYFEALAEGIAGLVAPIWLELVFVGFFAVGVQLTASKYYGKGTVKQKSKRHESDRPHLLHKQIEADVEAGDWASAIKKWREAKHIAPAFVESTEVLKAILRAYLEVEPDKLVEEFVEHFKSLANTRELEVNYHSNGVNVVLDVVSRAGRVDLLDELANAFKSKLNIASSAGTFEILIGGHASAGNEETVDNLFAEARRCHPKALMSRGHSLAVKGFLKNAMVSAALRQIQEMQRKGCPVPSFTMAQLFRTACQNDHGVETFEAALAAEGVKIPQDAIVALLDECAKRSDLQLAVRIEKIARKSMDQLPAEAYDALMKVCISHKDEHAIELFRNMQAEGLHINVGFCIWILARCHDSQFSSFSDEIVGYVHSRSGMTVACYNALLKNGLRKSKMFVDLYATKIMMKALTMMENPKEFPKVWELIDNSGVDVTKDDALFDQVLETCTRHRQTARLESMVASSMDIKLCQPSLQRLVSLLKACGSLKQVDRCHQLWQKIQSSCSGGPNSTALESMIEALVSSEAVDDAVAHLAEWKPSISPTKEMYISIIKGYTAASQPSRAMELWQDRSKSPFVRDIGIFNYMIESQARVGAMEEVCKLVASMPKHGVVPTSTTYSAIIRGYCIKGSSDPDKAKGSSDLDKAFDVFCGMQKKGLAIECAAYNTIMDHSIRNSRMDIADSVLEDLENKLNSNAVKPSTFTLGILIKMYGRRNRLDKAFQAVRDFSSKHGSLKPNIQVRTALMCACLSNHDLDRAMKVFEEIKVTGAGADAKTYGLMLSGLSRMGSLTEAVAIVEEAYGLGQSRQRGLATGQVFESNDFDEFVRALRQKKVLQSLGGPLFDRMHAANVPIPGKLLHRGERI